MFCVILVGLVLGCSLFDGMSKLRDVVLTEPESLWLFELSGSVISDYGLTGWILFVE